MKVLFVSSRRSGKINPIIKAQAQSLVKAGFEVQHFGILGSGILGYLITVKELKRVSLAFQPEVVHAHYGFCGWIALLAGLRKKTLVSFMGDDVLGSENEQGKVTFFSKIFVFINVLLARFVYKHTIVKSLQMESKVASKNTSVIANGVNIEVFKAVDKKLARQELGFSLDDPIIIFVSNPERLEKNFALASDSVKLLSASGAQLIKVFNKSPVEVALHMSAADVLVLSSFHEGSPNVIKEAMACNCPIVSTDVGDVQYVIKASPGCYITKSNPDEMATALEEALKFSKDKDRTSGRDRIIELKLDSKSTADRIINCYSKIIN